MASRLRSRLKLLSPYIDEKVFRNLERRLESIPQPERKPKNLNSISEKKGYHIDESNNTTQESVQNLPQRRTDITTLHNKHKGLFSTCHACNKALDMIKEALHLQIKVSVDKWYQTNTAELDVKSIYKTLPNAKVALEGTTPEPRFLWKERGWPNGFPDSPEEAKTDVMTYLEQKDCYRRLQKLDMKDFSVGSIVAVTRADPLIAKGRVKFVGICIAKNHWQNTLGATFTLRNVVEGEPVEVNFQLYSPLIQRIEVLKHMRRHRKALWYLRDYPPSMSSVNEKMKAVPYTEEPELYIPTKEEKKKVKAWFSGVWKAKRR